jgi:hypothetical protein
VQLSDLSISNRVYFFNKEDLVLTQQLIEDSGGGGGGGGGEGGSSSVEDRTAEPLAIIQEAKVSNL